VATAILKEGLKLGEIHISSAEVSLENRYHDSAKAIEVAGFVCAAIKDGKSNKKIYLEPKSAKFQEIIYNNTIQKYEALFGQSYEGELKIEVLSQKPEARVFFYNNGVMRFVESL